ncbi:hypothetical protein Taro_023166 [Colocasia esculenta]|uniref:Uncharacterized protein n=1 Tax=Colocasia esculenta TaxID=4460 RepID=A0A843V369_COLES|nr:hypothetical protein [Colocasia esculenta]
MKGLVHAMQTQAQMVAALQAQVQAQCLSSLHVNIKERALPGSFYLLKMKDYDAILGLDWLEEHYALMDCRRKIITFPDSRCEAAGSCSCEGLWRRCGALLRSKAGALAGGAFGVQRRCAAEPEQLLRWCCACGAGARWASAAKAILCTAEASDGGCVKAPRSGAAAEVHVRRCAELARWWRCAACVDQRRRAQPWETDPVNFPFLLLFAAAGRGIKGFLSFVL